jgi:hypothetical protein
MKFALLAAALVCAGAAQSQTVWRCGAEGRDYGDVACPGGTQVAVADTRSAAQLQAAREQQARDRALALELVQERREREREALARGPGLVGIKAEPPPKLKPAASKGKAKSKPALYQAVAPGISPSVALASRRKPG